MSIDNNSLIMQISLSLVSVTGHQPVSSIFNSLDRRSKKKKPSEDAASVRLKRRYSNPDNFAWGRTQHIPEKPPQDVTPRRKLNRSVSDAGRRDDKDKENRSSIFGTLDRIRKKKKPPSLSESVQKEEIVPPVRKKKQLSPIIEMSPKVEADPWRFAAAAPTTVVYAEVVARPGGKTTVHTAVPTDPSTRLEPGESLTLHPLTHLSHLIPHHNNA